MNVNIKKLISFVRLQDDNSQVVNSVIGYLTTIDKVDESHINWSYIINKIVSLDLRIITLVEKELDDVNSIRKLKDYSVLFNDCYNFINEEGYIIPFINEAPFNNKRVNNISNYNIYILARKTYLDEANK